MTGSSRCLLSSLDDSPYDVGLDGRFLMIKSADAPPD